MRDEELYRYIFRTQEARRRTKKRYDRSTKALFLAYIAWLIVIIAFIIFYPWGEKEEGPQEVKSPLCEPKKSEEAETERIEVALVEQGYFSDAIPLSYDLQDVIQTECERYGIDYCLVLGLIETESSFDPDADNGLCYGLMQLNRDYFPDKLTPAENIQAGIEYLADQLGRYETVEAALCGYNAGHDTGARDYANAVLAAAERWEEQLNER